jgi:hypothetical protein
MASTRLVAAMVSVVGSRRKGRVFNKQTGAYSGTWTYDQLRVGGHLGLHLGHNPVHDCILGGDPRMLGPEANQMTTSKTIAGLIGPTLVAIAAGMLLNIDSFPALAEQVSRDPALIFVSGILLFVAGLAIVRVHNSWTNGWPTRPPRYSGAAAATATLQFEPNKKRDSLVGGASERPPDDYLADVRLVIVCLQCEAPAPQMQPRSLSTACPRRFSHTQPMPRQLGRPSQPASSGFSS